MFATRRPLFGRVVLGTLAVGATTLAATGCGLPLLPPALTGGGGETVAPEPTDTAAPTTGTETTEPVETETDQPAGPEDADVFSLTVGDCLNEMSSSSDGVSEVPKIDCSEPHDYEVYHAEDIQASEYPGDDQVNQMAEGICRDAFDGFVGIPYPESALYHTQLTPTEDGWTRLNDREVLCLIYEPDTQVTGSLEGSAY
ncbi:septum formation family protein [Nocardiopsis halotolerans]|uniref:septum formation family protein n=1 Tax=Nocardiopsis halotolerans TaxID=124252 RepID=UPI00034CFC87|nr:septum formation family protein [Nocardiopsis halotolerans]